MLRAMAVGGALQSTKQAAERQAVIQEYMDRDPHLHYTMVSRSAGAPETLPAEQTFISVTLLAAGQEIRIDGSERYPGAIADLGAGRRWRSQTMRTADAHVRASITSCDTAARRA
jgi:hypothetical protein